MELYDRLRSKESRQANSRSHGRVTTNECGCKGLGTIRMFRAGAKVAPEHVTATESYIDSFPSTAPRRWHCTVTSMH